MKENRASCSFILHTQDRGVRMLRAMEEHGARVSGGVLRVVEPVVVPEDYDKLVAALDPGVGKPTVSRLRSAAKDILQSRYWV